MTFVFFPGTEIQGSVNTLESNDVFSVEHSVASLSGKKMDKANLDVAGASP